MIKPFITTFTGRKVNPLELRPEDICVEDIAHHTALLNRFVGASRGPISIAQHQVYVYRLLRGTGWEREGLFHDAAEAYLGDVSKWVKKAEQMTGYRSAELAAWYAICSALNLRVHGDPDVNEEVQRADNLMVRYEHLMEGHPNHHLFEVPTHPKPTEEEIKFVEFRCGPWHTWHWKRAEVEFLMSASELGYVLAI